MPKGVKGFQKGHTINNGKKPKNLELLHSLPRTKEWRARLSEANKGNKGLPGLKNPSWKGGITPKLHLLRNTRPHREWSAKIIERDKCCQQCGAETNLVAHHLLPFDIYPDSRLDLENGQTLCRACHMNHHRHEY